MVIDLVQIILDAEEEMKPRKPCSEAVIQVEALLNFVPIIVSCAIWSLTLREDRRLRVLENRILRRIFGPKSDENGEWRRFHKASQFVSFI